MNKWKQSINIKQHLNEGETLEQTIQAAKGVYSELLRLKVDERDYTIADIKMQFEDMASLNPSTCSEDPDDLCEEFNYQLNELYDWADYHRVWLGL